MSTEKRQDTCPQCQNSDAVCTHGLVNGDGHPVHEWDCPTCGESTAVVLDECEVCKSFAREVTIPVTAVLEAILPGPYGNMQRAFVEVVQADAERRWLVACNGFAIVFYPFHEDCTLDKTGVVEASDIEAERAARPDDGTPFYMETHAPAYEYPDISRIVTERMLGREYKPVAVLDAKMLYQMARAMRYDPSGEDEGYIVTIYAEQPGQKKPEGNELGSDGFLVVPPRSDPCWEGHPWGFLMAVHPGKPGSIALLMQIRRETQERMGDRDD